MNRNAAALAGGHRLAPVALFGQRVQDVHEIGTVGEQRAPALDGSFPSPCAISSMKLSMK